MPRLAFGAVNLSQPFLVNRAIDLIDEPNVEFHQSIVGGLIGATALVYVGIAVRSGDLISTSVSSQA